MSVDTPIRDHERSSQIPDQVLGGGKPAGIGWAPGADLRPAVAIALVLGLVISLRLPAEVEPLTRIIIYWDTFIVIMRFVNK